MFLAYKVSAGRPDQEGSSEIFRAINILK